MNVKSSKPPRMFQCDAIDTSPNLGGKNSGYITQQEVVDPCMCEALKTEARAQPRGFRAFKALSLAFMAFKVFDAWIPPNLTLDLSSSSSCWNIGRRAFSISVCRWQISLHPSMWVPYHVSPHWMLSARSSLVSLVCIYRCQVASSWPYMLVRFPAEVRYGPQISASFVAQSQISFPNQLFARLHHW